MMRLGARSRAGFTLVELLVGAALSAAVMAAVLSSYIYIGRNLARLANQQTLETEGRRTLANFSRDVRAASGLVAISASPTSPATDRVDLIVPSGSTTNTITYYYNGTADPVSVTISGSSVSMPANSLTRCLYNGTSVMSLTLLRNITTSGLTIRYYDVSGAPYTSYTDYLSGIKQLTLEFSTQLGTSDNGTQTRVHHVASNRLILRNRGFLP
jgi:prepilin-type N-terminal cleavage/methylation domain-containing protein